MSSKQPPMKQGSSDDFQTPVSALTPLFPYIKKDWVIWECACGNGNLVSAFKDRGFNVIGTDIKGGDDFLTYNPDSFDCIITNPPYKYKQQFLQRAYALGKPFAFLLPLTTLEGKVRQKLFKEYGVELILFDKRINFETPSGNGSGSWFMTMWVTYGLNIGKQLTFTNYMG